MSKNNDQRKALGKGLSALLPSRHAAPSSAPPPPTAQPEPSPSVQNGFVSIPTNRIYPNPLQPRTIFQADRLQELAASITANGIIQPLVVQRKGSGYELIAGERRWRAAQIAGLAEVPAVIQERAFDKLLEVALIENIQREDLNAIEVATALERLSKDYGLSHEEIGRRTGKDRATISNLIRLLRLPDEIQLLVAENRLSMGHARALLAVENPEEQVKIAEKAAAHGMSVRQLERHIQGMVRKMLDEPASTPDPNVSAATREMESVLGTRVRIVPQNDRRGKVEIEYYTPEDLDRIFNVIVAEKK